LHEVLAGEKGSSSCREQLVACLSEMKEQYRGGADAASDLPTESVAQSIREKLAASGLSDEDSEEDFEGVCRSATSPRPQAKEKSRTSSAKLVVRTVQLKDHDVLAAIYKRQVLLQYSQENLQTFLSLAKKYTSTDVDEKKHETAERRQLASGDTWFH
jgi:hypothetical protein